MTIKDDLKREANDFSDDYEEKKPKEKPKKSDNEYEILELKRCVKDKDKRISKLEKRLNDRVKYYYTAGVIAIFVCLVALIIYLCLVDIETLRIWMIGIGIMASILGSIIMFIVCMWFIWDDKK